MEVCLPDRADASSLRVAVYTFAYPTLSETFIRAQVEYLQAQVICRQCPLDKVPTGVHVIDGPHAVEGIGAKLAYLRRRVFVGRYPGYWLTEKAEHQLERTLNSIAPNVLLAAFGAGLIDVAATAKRLSIPVVVHFHGHDLSRQLRYPAYVKALRRSLAESAAAVVVNTAMVNRVRALAPDLKIQKIPYGFPIPKAIIRSGEPPANARIVAVGRLVEKKDPLGLLRVADQLSRWGVVGELRIIGDGPLRAVFEAALPGPDKTFAVVYLGAQPHEVVLHEIATSSVYIQLSRVAKNGDEEGWPVSIAEAMSAGLPVVATKSPGIVDQVLGESGVLIAPGDYDAAANAVRMYLEDQVLAKAAGNAALSLAKEYSRNGVALPALREVLTVAAQCSSLSKRTN